MSQYFLITQRGKEIGSIIRLENRQITIGRNSDNDLMLNDPLVSRYHSVIQPDRDGQFRITDLASTNGILVNGEKLEPGAPFPLSHRDTIFIGNSVFNFHIRPDNYQPSAQPNAQADSGATMSLQYQQLYS